MSEVVAENSTSGIRGRPFQKGQSGNPGGVSKKLKRLQRLLAAYAPEAVDKLVEIMRTAPETKDQLAAAKTIMEYSVPKPKQQVEHKIKRASAEISPELASKLAGMQ